MHCLGIDSFWVFVPYTIRSNFKRWRIVPVQSGFDREIVQLPQKPIELGRGSVLRLREDGMAGLQLQIPLWTKGNNLEPARLEAIPQTLGIVAKELKEYGLSLSLQDAKITRLDLCSNLQTEKPYLAYGLLLDSLGAVRQKKLPGKKHSKTWHGWGNKSRAIILYNKADQSLLEGNLMRCETRFTTCASVGKAIGGKFVSDLLRLSDSELAELYHNQVRGLFRYDYSEYQAMLKSLHFETVANIIANSGQGKGNPITQILAVMAIRGELITRQGLIDMVFLAIDQLGYEGQQKWNKRSQFKAAIGRCFDSAIQTAATDKGLRLVDQYQELREGFLHHLDLVA